MIDIQWLFFDISGVLTDDTGLEKARNEIVSGAVQSFRPKPTAEELRDARARASAKNGGLVENMIRELLSDRSAACADATKEADALWRRLPDRGKLSVLRPNALEVLRPLSKKYKLGLMTNQTEAAKEKILGSELLSCFKHKGLSEGYGFHKPDPRLFQAILRETGADPARSIMIDDNFERGLQPARDLGFRTVLYKESAVRAGAVPKTDWTISDLYELVTLFS